jgi:hypothetical protein
MSFQTYCDLIRDDQKVKAEKTLLLTYTNSKGEAFSISPECNPPIFHSAHL